MFRLIIIACFVLAASLVRSSGAQGQDATPPDYGAWKNGISDDPNYFPLAVWLQSPRNAERYKQAGINLFVGLWNGPTEEQLASLKKVGMDVICSQNQTALTSENADIIVAWMHGDEPDNAQSQRGGGYGPPVEPSVIEENYQRIRERDPTRPVLLNLGQGVAYDDYIGRGVRRNHPEDYPLYIRGCDIVSFDIYPVVHDKPEVAGKLEFVPNGVERLRRWSNDEKIVWNCIECSRISNTEVKPAAEQVRAEVWMSLIAGSRGIIYFVHQFEPRFIEASLLEDAPLLVAVTALNKEIRELAPVLNAPTSKDEIKLESSNEPSPIRILCKRHEDSLYAFVANHSNEAVSANLAIQAPLESTAVAKEIDTGEAIELRDATMQLNLAAYGIALVRVSGAVALP